MVTSQTNTYKLPDVGEGLTEADLVTWYVKVGDTVKVNDVLCDIETAKSVVELPSPYAGVVQELLVPEGETVEVGTPIIRIGDAAEPGDATERGDAAEAEETAESAEKAEPAIPGSGEATEESPATLVGSGPKESAVTRRPRTRTVRTGAHAANVQTQAVFENAPSPDVEIHEDADHPPVLAKPTARSHARELGIELESVTPTREDGVITVEDVDAAAGQTDGQSDGQLEEQAGGLRGWATSDGVREHREPIKGLRKTMGQAMVDSAFTAPHVTIWTTVDVTRSVELLDRLKGHRDFREVKVSPLLLAAKASLIAMRRTPLINSFWDDDTQEIVVRNYVNLGIAAATPRGLVVPHVKEAQSLSLAELGSAINALTATAREGRTPPGEQIGGTFTITNVGPFGMEAGTPIINPGESAILCLGAIQRRPWVVGSGESERLLPRDVCTLALSFDHRHIDGATGSTFLADVAGVLEDPATALLL